MLPKIQIVELTKCCCYILVEWVNLFLLLDIVEIRGKISGDAKIVGLLFGGEYICEGGKGVVQSNAVKASEI